MLQAQRVWGIEEVLVRDLLCWWHIQVALPFKCKGKDSEVGVGQELRRVTQRELSGPVTTPI